MTAHWSVQTQNSGGTKWQTTGVLTAVSDIALHWSHQRNEQNLAALASQNTVNKMFEQLEKAVAGLTLPMHTMSEELATHSLQTANTPLLLHLSWQCGKYYTALMAGRLFSLSLRFTMSRDWSYSRFQSPSLRLDLWYGKKRPALLR